MWFGIRIVLYHFKVPLHLRETETQNYRQFICDLAHMSLRC